MADQDAQDRTLPASPRKLQKAREEGQTVRSRDFGHFSAIAAIVALVAATAPWVSGWLREALAASLRFNLVALQNPGFMAVRLAELTSQMLWLALVPGCVATATAIGAGAAIGGWNFTLKPLQPQFGKFNPLTGMQRLLSSDQLIDTLKASGLALLLGSVGALYLKSHAETMVGLLAVPLPAAIAQAAQIVLNGVLLLLLTLAVFAGIDVPLQRHLHAKRLRMSHQERKQEHKESEGNGEIKAKVRQLMREASRRRMMAAVPTADLVVMNPTHYAVALKYEDGRMAAPRVVAKGADLLALAIRDLARSSQVPVLQAPVLARALYAHAELDREIPAALFAAVAQVLAYVYQLRAAMGGRVPMPGELPELQVPPELDPHHEAAE
jgi:flagellar biosynthetic protein FlhB